MNKPRPKIIAITGGSGAGKTWLAERLQSLLGGAAQRLCLDVFYRDRSHLPPGRRDGINYDHPRCIDWPLVGSVLAQLKAGRPVRVPRYDFGTHARLSESDTLAPGAAIVVDGLWLLRRPELRALFDLSIFLDCPAACRLEWRLARDTVERGRSAASVRRQFGATVAPMHDLFVEPQRQHAHLVLRQPLTTAEADLLFERLWALLVADAVYPAARREVLRARTRRLLANVNPLGQTEVL